MKKWLKKNSPLFLLNLYHALYSVCEALIYSLYQKVVTHMYAGIRLKININDPASNTWYNRNLKRGEIKFLQKYRLRPGANVFNIGAHQGVIALILSKLVGPTGHVVAVEMNKHNADMAKRNKYYNSVNNLQIIHAAVAEKKGTIIFSYDKVAFNPMSKAFKKIHSTSVDDLTLKYGTPSILYIDVEGYECEVLKGAKKTLRSLPDCCVEVHVKKGLESYGGSVAKLITFFSKKSYKLYMSPPTDKTHFAPFSVNSGLHQNRFYLIAISKATTIPKPNLN